MSATLNFDLQKAPPELFESGRWDILTQFILCANNNNRCYPTIRGMAKRTGKSLDTVNEAKKWLVSHGAITEVAFADRIKAEKKLPIRQCVYELTGRIQCGGRLTNYLYVNSEDNGDAMQKDDPDVLLGETSDVSLGRISAERNQTVLSLNSTTPNLATSENTPIAASESIPKVEEKPARTARTKTAAPPRPRNLLFDAVAENFFGGVGVGIGQRTAIIVNGGGPTKSQGILDYESARQSKPKSELDIAALADDVRKFKAWLRETFPTMTELRNNEKWMERWNEWRIATKGSSFMDWPEGVERWSQKINFRVKRIGNEVWYYNPHYYEWRVWLGHTEYPPEKGSVIKAATNG